MPDELPIYRHEGLHRTQQEWETFLLNEGSQSVSKAYNAHSHPALEISLHVHKGGEQPHRHLPTWDWDTTPVPLSSEGRQERTS